MKRVRLTAHSRAQCVERGASEEEVTIAVEQGTREPANMGRELCRFTFAFEGTWQGNPYTFKQVAPVIVEERDEVVVITVYTFYW